MKFTNDGQGGAYKVFINNLKLIGINITAISILFFFTFLIGKKLVSQLNFFDFIVGITIGSIAAAMIVDRTISYWDGVISLVIWGLVPIIAAKIALKSIPARKIIDGVPTIVIQNGKVLEENLRQQKYHINDLLEGLRQKGVFDIADVQSAVLETSGVISVQLKPAQKPITPSDLNKTAAPAGISANLIIDGKILQEHLHLVDRDEVWLKEELRKMKIESISKIMLASMDVNGNLYVDLKEDKLEARDVLK